MSYDLDRHQPQTRIMIDLDENTYAWLWKMAVARDCSVADVAGPLLAVWVERQELTHAELIRHQLEERQVKRFGADYGTINSPATICWNEPAAAPDSVESPADDRDGSG